MMPTVSLEKQASLSHRYLLGLLHYDHSTGGFYHRSTCGARIAGRRTGSIGQRGYEIITINRRPFLAHRLAWFYVHGTWPQFNIDHINGNQLDNRIQNLRDITQAHNVSRARRAHLNKSGFVGCRFNHGKWEASVSHDGKYFYLGRFEKGEAAYASYQAKIIELFGVDLPHDSVPVAATATPCPETFIIPKAARAPLTQVELASLVEYDQETGLFRRRKILNGRGSLEWGSGRIDPIWGMRHIKIRSISYLAHRLAWLYMTGNWPTSQVDHKDRNPDNNSWENLRLATATQNVANRRKFKNNSSGATGVSRIGNKWLSVIYMNGKRHVLGKFATLEAAKSAHDEAAKRLYGEFARAA